MSAMQPVDEDGFAVVEDVCHDDWISFAVEGDAVGVDSTILSDVPSDGEPVVMVDVNSVIGSVFG